MWSEKSLRVIAKTSFGLEEVLAEELRQLGVENLSIVTRAVIFEADKEMLYKANVWLRTANRLIVPFKEFSITSSDDLYDKVKEIAWDEIFDLDQSFAIDSTVFSEIFNHTQYAAFKTKDAIADRFREVHGERPNVDKDNANIRINLHISKENKCTISLDSSGTPLFKRGYRQSQSIAPLKEDLAAGLVLLSGWDRKSDFVDFFSGSGTILIEAAMIAYNIAPNVSREDFGFMYWKTYDDALFEAVLEGAEELKRDFRHKIIGTEIDQRVIGMAKANIKAAGLSDKIEVVKTDFKDFDAPSSKGTIVSNPPYGERIGENVDQLYKQLGDTLKQKYNGWNAWVISSNTEAIKTVGLRPNRRIKLFNGSLECRLMNYEMYQGSKREGRPEREKTLDSNQGEDKPKIRKSIQRARSTAKVSPFRKKNR